MTSNPRDRAAGPTADTYPALEQVIATCLAHPAPMAVLRGPDGLLTCNRSCLDLLGDRAPGAEGRPYREGWPELFAAIGGRHLSGPGEGRVSMAGGAGWSVRCGWAPVPADEAGAAGALVTFGAAEPLAGGNAPDLADLSSLDVGTICGTLGRLTVPSHAAWAIIWLRRVDRAGRARLERRDVHVPAGAHRWGGGSAELAARFGVARVIATGEALRRPAEVWDGRGSGPDGDGDSGEAVVSIPLRDKRGVRGVLTLGAPRVPAGDPVVQDLANRAGMSLANASRFRAEHTINQELQRLLAPRPLPAVRGVDLAARLVAGGTGVTVGGDWYDACQLSDGRLALTIGDVVGHGLPSAVEMSQLRTGLRSIALEGLSPADTLREADLFLRRTGRARFATCIHAVYRPSDGQLDMANAGHPRPAYLPRDRRPHAVPMGTGLPLGGAADLPRSADQVAVATCRMVLDPGESVLMFTDGLVENRSRSIDEGTAQLLDLLAGLQPSGATGNRMRARRHRPPARGPDARGLCDAVLASMRGPGGRERDDVAVLVLRRRKIAATGARGGDRSTDR